DYISSPPATARQEREASYCARHDVIRSRPASSAYARTEHRLEISSSGGRPRNESKRQHEDCARCNPGTHYTHDNTLCTALKENGSFRNDRECQRRANPAADQHSNCLIDRRGLGRRIKCKGQTRDRCQNPGEEWRGPSRC